MADNDADKNDADVKEDVDVHEDVDAVKAPWVCYLIVHVTGATYVGVSPTPFQRLRKHNSEIKGGAKYTTSKSAGGWSHVCLIHGFLTSQQALQFEWAFKHVPPKKVGGLASRLNKLQILLHKKNWTKNAPPAKTVPLVIEWHNNLTPSSPFFDKLPPYVTQRKKNNEC
jgi:predicted GIY-YIG superfamily endonuclease